MLKRIYIACLLLMSASMMMAERATSVTVNDWMKDSLTYTKPLHYLGLSGRLGYSQFNMPTKDLTFPGGANVGLEFRYKMEYRAFRMTAGLDLSYLGSSMRGSIKTPGAAISYPVASSYVFHFDGIREQQDVFEIGIPVMVGGDYKGFYGLAGLRLGIPVANKYHTTADVQRGVKNMQGIDEYQGVHNLYRDQMESKGKLDLNINPQVAVELGMNLDRWLQYRPEREVGVKPSFRELLHYEVAVFANVGVMDYHKKPSVVVYQDQEPTKVNETSFTKYSAIATKNMVPWSIGVKFNVYYELYDEHKKPVVEEQLAPKPVEPVVEPEPEPEPVVVVEPEPEPVVEPEPAPVVEIVPENSHLYFETNVHTMNAERSQQIEDLAKQMKDMNYLKVLLIGHTDNVGTADYNMGLSQRRAEEVKKALVAHGIDGNRIEVKFVGLRESIASNETEEGRAQNRCVQVIFSKKD